MTSDQERQSSNAIHVMLISDANYASYLATTIVSVLKNAAQENELFFHIVDGGLRTSDRDAVEELKKIRPFQAVFYRPDGEAYLNIFSKCCVKYSSLVFYRLLAQHFLPSDLDRVIYLDVDVAVLSSLRELWETPFDGAFLAAAPDKYMPKKHLEELGIKSDYEYFNAGILLLNLAEWRRINLPEIAVKIFEEYGGKVSYAEQDLLNIYASRTSRARLEPDWNCHPRDYVEGKTRIIHYMGGRYKAPYVEILEGYAALTPYRRLPFQDPLWRLKERAVKAICSIILCKEWRYKIRKRLMSVK